MPTANLVEKFQQFLTADPEIGSERWCVELGADSARFKFAFIFLDICMHTAGTIQDQ